MEIECYYWLYMYRQINVSEFRRTLLDHITYVTKYKLCIIMESLSNPLLDITKFSTFSEVDKMYLLLYWVNLCLPNPHVSLALEHVQCVPKKSVLKHIG